MKKSIESIDKNNFVIQIEKEDNRIFYFPFSANELAAIISSARWAIEAANGELDIEDVGYLKQVISNFEIVESKLEEKLC